MKKIKVYENVTGTVANGYGQMITPPTEGYYTLYQISENNTHIRFEWEKQDKPIGNGNFAFYSYSYMQGRYEETAEGKTIKTSDEVPKWEEMQ